MRVTVLIPAHNESDQIASTIAALRRQTRRPDEIVVVADNCTDDTAVIATHAGAEVFTTVGNTGRKAGAINQALALFLPGACDEDCVLVMDADTELSPRWIETAARELQANPRVAVGGTYLGKEEAPSLVRQLQINEFTRASRLQYRKSRKSVWCLSGTGTMARAAMLREIAACRGTILPGRPGDVYDADSCTEDFELTLAVRTLGYSCIIPRGCESRTEVMPTARTWFNQRLRWQHGTLESLRDYGFTRVTWGWNGWTRQGLFHLRFVAQFLLWFVLIHSLLTTGAAFPPLIVAALVVVYSERVISVWRSGWRGRILAALIVPVSLPSSRCCTAAQRWPGSRRSSGAMTPGGTSGPAYSSQPSRWA
jgi:poly-beta-1,6-N-acetyl-D-glucosamine synthase